MRTQPFSRILQCARKLGAFSLLIWVIVAGCGERGLGQTISPRQEYGLRHVSAAEVVPQLRALLDGARSNAEIFIDRQRNSVWVQGTSESQRLAAQMIQTLDRQPSGRPEVADAIVVEGYPVPPADLEAIAERIKAAYPGARVAPDVRTSQLIIAAPASVQRRIAGEFAAARLPQADSPIITRLAPVTEDLGASHRLQHTSWREFEDALRRIWGDQLEISTQRNGELATVKLAGNEGVMHIDRRGDLVTFEGADDQARRWKQVAAALDTPRGGRNQRTEVVPTSGAYPESVFRAVSLINNAVRQSGQDDATTALRVDRASGRRTWGGDLVSMIFQPGAEGAGQVDQAAPGEAGEEEGLFGPVQIEFIEGLNIFIVKGHKRDVDRVLKIIDEIIALAETTAPEVEIYPLRYVNNQAVAQLVLQLYDQVFAARQANVSITPLGKPNALLLIGPREGIESVKQLVAKIDQRVPPSSQFRVFRLKYAPAADVAQQIITFYPQATGQAAAPGAPAAAAPGVAPGAPAAPTVTGAAGGGLLATQVNVISDYRSNSLIVQASPGDMAEIAALIRKLDVDDTAGSLQVRVFPLKHTLAADLQAILTAAFTGQAVTTAGAQAGQFGAGVAAAQPFAAGQQQTTRPSKSIEMIQIDEMNNQIIVRSKILTDVSVTADTNQNSLVVLAPADSMQLIATLIEQLDRVPSAEAVIKVFTLENGDATNLTGMLQALFGQQVTVGQQGAFNTFGQVFSGAFGGAQTGVTSGAGENTLIPLRFSVDTRSNSIIVSGSEGDLNVVEAILVRMDETDLRTRKTTVYRLNNAQASQVAVALSTVLAQQLAIYQQTVAQQLTLISPLELIDQQIIVVNEDQTNSLIVNATPEYYPMITDVIEDLDRRPPMVMVQVLIAEVVLESDKEVGVELGLQDSLMFDRGIDTIGFPFIGTGFPNDNDYARGLLGGKSFSSFGVGTTSAGAGFPGLVLSASNESIQVLIRALEAQRRLQVLSRPQIMTLNNVPASILVGQRVPRVTDFTLTASGTTNSTTLDEAGLRLGVIPRVTPDGLIVIDFEVSRSSVGDVADGIPIGVQDGVAINSPIFMDTTATSTIISRDGQTIVFAGLITSAKGESSRGVPYLSRIPLLGRLFRFDTETDMRTELLIFMTPRIVLSGEEEQIDFINTTESERMSWCLADVVALHGNVGAVAGPGSAPLIYPDLEPGGIVPIETIEPGPVTKPYLTPPDQLRPGKPYLNVPPPQQMQGSNPLLDDADQSSRRSRSIMGSPTQVVAPQPAIAPRDVPLQPPLSNQQLPLGDMPQQRAVGPAVPSGPLPGPDYMTPSNEPAGFVAPARYQAPPPGYPGAAYVPPDPRRWR